MGNNYIGIEAINLYSGEAFIEVKDLFKARGLDLDRYDNLMMYRKSVAMPYEDPVSYAVNAAAPLVDRLSVDEKKQIEMLIVASESGIDFGKTIANYVHEYLGLSKNCRMFEVKQACYSGTASLQTALNFVTLHSHRDVKSLVICSDVARPVPNTYVEPSQGVGAIALLISNKPHILQLDLGANGYYGYEVMDTLRPAPDIETGDIDLSLLSYLDCLEHAFNDYAAKVEEVDFVETFDHLAFHTPFPGMVKGAHRNILRKLKRWSAEKIEEDFIKRLAASLVYCQQVGNIYSATTFLALISVIENKDVDREQRIGIFSYGSGCCSEFYSGVISSDSKKILSPFSLNKQLNNRYNLSIEEYDQVLTLCQKLKFGIQNFRSDFNSFDHLLNSQFRGKKRLVLKEINNYHRKYEWL